MATTTDKALALLDLFSMQQADWTVEMAAQHLGVSSSTAYTYVRSLADAGLITPVRGGRYALGPAIIRLDRLMRRQDLLIQTGRPALRRLVDAIEGEVVGLLCGRYKLQMMCVEQVMREPTDLAISFERGRAVPLYRGAASRAILAHLPLPVLRKLWDADNADIRTAGLGEDWRLFKAAMRAMRREGVLVGRGEVVPGLVGVSAPVFGPEGEIIGSVGVVGHAEVMEPDSASLGRIIALVATEAADMNASLTVL